MSIKVNKRRMWPSNTEAQYEISVHILLIFHIIGFIFLGENIIEMQISHKEDRVVS